MVIANCLPRYGTQEHKRLGLLLLAVLAVSIIMLMPAVAFAFDGSFKPNTQVGSNLDNSFRAWWKWLATPMVWVSLIWLIVSVAFFSGRGWILPVIIGGIFLFGEMVVDGFKSLMGG